jgi:NADH:ubiquinone oxidoreductase subunit 2 (subunit N)
MLTKHSILYKYIIFFFRINFLLLSLYYLFNKIDNCYLNFFLINNFNFVSDSINLNFLVDNLTFKITVKNILNYFSLEILLFFCGLFYIKKSIQFLKRGINEIVVCNYFKRLFTQHFFVIIFFFINPSLYQTIIFFNSNFFTTNIYIINFKFFFFIFYYLIFNFLCQYIQRYLIFLKLEFFFLFHYILFFSCLIFHVTNFLLLVVFLETIFFCLIFVFTGIFFRINLNFNNLAKNDIYIKTNNSYSKNLKNFFLQQKSFFAISGTITYFLYNAFALGLFLLAISFFFIFAETLSFFDFFLYLRTLLVNSIFIDQLWHYSNINKNIIIFFSFLFFIFFFFKVGLFPFHSWVIKIIMNLNYFSLIFLFIPYKIIIYFFLIYFYYHIVLYLNIEMFFFLLASLTIVVGSFGLILQYNIRKFLAYSTITHTGYIIGILACGTINSFQAVILYLIVYLITLYGFFLIIAFSKKKNSNRPVISFLEFSNILGVRINIWKHLLLLLFSLLGVPPLAGFWVKLNILEQLLITNTIWSFLLVFCIIVTTGLSTIGYLRIIKIFFFKTKYIQEFSRILLYPFFINCHLIICSLFILFFPLIYLFVKNFNFFYEFYFLMLLN